MKSSRMVEVKVKVSAEEYSEVKQFCKEYRLPFAKVARVAFSSVLQDMGDMRDEAPAVYHSSISVMDEEGRTPGLSNLIEDRERQERREELCARFKLA